MNGKKAKKLRKIIFKDGNFREDRKYNYKVMKRYQMPDASIVDNVTITNTDFKYKLYKKMKRET